MRKSLKKTDLKRDDSNAVNSQRNRKIKKQVSCYDILFDYTSRLVFNIVYFAVKDEDKHCIKNQKKILKNLVWNIKDTKFWRKFDFWSIYELDDIYSQFSLKTPIFEYSDFKKYIELSKVEENVIWPWKINKFSISSWTTGNKKYIPVTRESMKSTTKAWTYMFADLLHRFSWLKIFRWDFLPLVWTIQESKNWFDAWDVSVLILKSRKWVTSKRYSLPETVLINPDWNDKLDRIFNMINVNRENTIMWATSWAYEILRYIEKNDRNKFNKLINNMELVIWWWVDVAPFMHYFKECNLNYIWVYNASEWYFAFQDVINYANSNWDAPYKLLNNHWIFYEFLEFNSDNFDENWNVRKGAVAKPIWMLDKTDLWKKFALIITTNWWLVRYLIWDVISFVDENFRFKIVWRTRHSINLMWEELMETHVNSVIKKLSDEDWVNVTYYTIWPDKEEWPTCHEWIIECDNELSLSSENLIEKIDLLLQEINPDYKAKRKNNRLLWIPKIHIVKKWTFVKRLDSKGKLWSQNKVPKLSSKRNLIREILKIS